MEIQALPRLIPTEAIVPTAKALLAQLDAARTQVADNVTVETACFNNVVQPLIDAENETDGGLSFITMLRYASPDQAARKASEEAVKLWRASSTDFTARKDLYLLLKAVTVRAEKLDFEAAKYLERKIQDFTRCGHGRLDDDQIKVYLDRRNEIDELRSIYNGNIRDEAGGLWFTEEELDGVPEQDLSRFIQGEVPDHRGMRFVHFTRAESSLVFKYARNPATRKKMYSANARKLPNNLELFKEVVIRRNRNAHLLGYASHAAFRLERRVAKTPEWVCQFLDNVEDVLIPQGEKEMQSLLQRKKKHLAENPEYPSQDNNTILPWDKSFYITLSQGDMDVQHKRIAEFFPLQNTLSAMLQFFATCLQLRFEQVLEKDAVNVKWHKDVKIWSVWDIRESSQGEFIGYLYADLLWRPNKHQGSQNVNIQCGYRMADGTRVNPATILMCSFPRPTSNRCALLEHHNVVSLFHELGHGIHDLVSKTSYTAFHGHRSPPDFAEVPSMMIEKWCWMVDELIQMSCHYTTLDATYLEQWQSEHHNEPPPPKKIPRSMLEGLIRSRKINMALSMLFQVAVSRFDMAVHNVQSHEDCARLNPTDIYNTYLEKIEFSSNPDPGARGHSHVNFGHLLAGYDAGYYGYLSAQAFAADIFQTNFANGPRSQAAWDRYRQGILEYGASRDELQMLEDFLGHPPTATALLSEFDPVK